MVRCRSLSRTLLMLLTVSLGLAYPSVAAEVAIKSFEGALLSPIESRTQGKRAIRVATLQNTENEQLEVVVTGPAVLLNTLEPGDIVEVRYPDKDVKPVEPQAVQVKRGQFEGVVEQIDGKASLKVRAGTRSEALMLPVGPADLAKGLSPGDTVEGIYTQDSLDKPKFVQSVYVKRMDVSTVGAATIMALGIIVFLIIAMVLLKVGGFKLRKLVIGGDNRTSNSKTQAAIWFGIVIASYIAMLMARVRHGGWAYIGGIDIPQNLLILSGISAGTFAGAKLVTANRVASGIPKPAAGSASPVDLFSDDRGRFDLGDFQMFAWALLAAGVYLLQMVAFLKVLPLSASASLPDVDTTLLSFFGIGQGAYLAKKGFGEVHAQITGITPPQAAPGAIIAVSGSGFGERPGYVRFGSAMARVISWIDSSVSAEVPRGLMPGQVPVQVVLTAESVPPATGLRESALPPVSFSVLRSPVDQIN